MTPIPIPRLILFLTLAVYMVLMPGLTHVFGVRTPAVRSWRMFHGYGNDVCEVRFSTVKGGATTPIDRCEVLGYTGCSAAPAGVRLLHDRDAVLTQAKKICGKLEPGTELRGVARCGGEEGWKTRFSGQQDLCTLAPPAAPGKVKRPESTDEEIP